MIKMVKANEYLELIKKDTSRLNEEEKYELKHFSPHYLDIEAWDEKNIEISLRDININVSAYQKICDKIV